MGAFITRYFAKTFPFLCSDEVRTAPADSPRFADRSACLTRIRETLVALGFGFALCSVPAHALPLLAFPTADDLAGPVFVQPFAGLQVVSVSGAMGRTDVFFSNR